MPEAITLPNPGGPSVAYTLTPGQTFVLDACSFVADLSGAASAGDVIAECRTPTGLLIAGEAPGSGQAAGSVVQYALAPFLNPCDGTATTALTLAPDTFPAVELTEGCTVTFSVVDSTTGAALAGALITNGVLWVRELGTGTEPGDVVPPYTSLAFDQQLATA
jgi:hypothetical protein